MIYGLRVINPEETYHSFEYRNPNTIPKVPSEAQVDKVEGGNLIFELHKKKVEESQVGMDFEGRERDTHQN